MSTIAAAQEPIIAKPLRSAAAASRTAFAALLLRDLTVLRKNLGIFIARTLIQPFLLVFVFLYVFPQIGEGIGGGSGLAGESLFAAVLVSGVVGLSIMFQGIQAVALPLATEFGYTKEIEDRVLAPLPVSLVAIGKVIAGSYPGSHRRGYRIPDSFGRPRHRRASKPVGALGDTAHPHPAGLHHDLRLRPGARDPHLPPQYQRHVRLHSPAHNVSRRYLLSLDNTGSHQNRRFPLAAGARLP